MQTQRTKAERWLWPQLNPGGANYRSPHFFREEQGAARLRPTMCEEAPPRLPKDEERLFEREKQLDYCRTSGST